MSGSGLSQTNKSSTRDNTIVEIEDGAGSGRTAEVVNRTNSSKGIATEAEIAGSDSVANYRRVNTKVRSDGLVALATDATVVVESTFGVVDRPFTYFTVINTGTAGNTITINIAGTAADTTSPDMDAPAYSKVFTVVAGEVGDEPTLTKRIISELNLDSAFRTQAFLKATRATDRNVVIIRSDKFSQSGEFWERPLAGDFTVTTTGTAQVAVGYDNVISRSIPVVINPDVDSGHRLGRFGISGAVTVTATALSDLFTAEATYSGSSSLLVNGSVTPVVFTVPAQSTQIFIEDMFFHGQGNGIQFGKFLSQNQPLAAGTGVLVSIKSDNIITTFPELTSTEDFKNKWAALSGDGANFRIDVQSGRDEILAILRFNNPFLLRETGAFGVGNDDYIRVTIRANLSSNIYDFRFRVKGFEKEP